MSHCPQFGRYNPETKMAAQRDLNPRYRYECDNCGWARGTDDSISMICPECQFPLNLFSIDRSGHPKSCW